MALPQGAHALTELRADQITRDTIDVNDGIERVMGNRDLYARMLRRFRNDYQDGALPIRTALASDDMVLAHRLVHTLKGAAGMIGAQRLHARASELEQSLRLETGDFRTQLASLVTEIEKVLQLLNVLLDGSPPPGMPVQIPDGQPPGDSALLDKLTALLSQRSAAVMDLLEASRAQLHVILGEDLLLRVNAAVRELDYERALHALGETACGQGI
jgi:HPt (histidine-containing phosphotransfer) domain-containing protein